MRHQKKQASLSNLHRNTDFSECEGFINGFRLGVRLMVEAIRGAD